MTRITNYETDNRDTSETWLELEDGTVVEVYPQELFYNAIENTYCEVKLDDFFVQLFEYIKDVEKETICSTDYWEQFKTVPDIIQDFLNHVKIKEAS